MMDETKLIIKTLDDINMNDEDVDIVIVTPVLEFSDIVSILSNKTKARCVSLSEMLNDIIKK